MNEKAPESTEEAEAQLPATALEDAEGHGSFEIDSTLSEGNDVPSEVNEIAAQEQSMNEKAQIEAIRAELIAGAGNRELSKAPEENLREVIQSWDTQEIYNRINEIHDELYTRNKESITANNESTPEGRNISSALSSESARLEEELTRRTKEKARAKFAAYIAANPEVETPITASTAPEKQGLLKRVGGWFTK